jgi:hypothetical protein
MARSSRHFAPRLAIRLHTAQNVGMPFKSQSQRRKFAQLLVEGKISGRTFEEWNRETGKKRLPERVAGKRQAAKKR